jgi:hypothetical protein
MRSVRFTALATMTALAAALVGCGGGSDDASKSSSSRSSAASSRAVASASSASQSSSAAASSSPQPCAGGSLPTDATDISHVSGDLDGNGGADAVTVYKSGGAGQLLVELGANGTTAAPITDLEPSDPVGPRALGTARVGGDRDIAFVRVGSGASTNLVALYGMRGCELVRLTLPGHDPFAIGGTVTHLDGLQCADGVLRVNSATTEDGETYATSVQEAHVENGALVPAGAPTAGSITNRDPGLNDLGSLACAGVEAP